MKKLLLGILAINLTFISALALSSVEAVHAQVTPQDLNEINSETSGDITLGGGEESDEGEESGGDANLNDLNSKTNIVIPDGGGGDPGGGGDIANQIKKIEGEGDPE